VQPTLGANSSIFVLALHAAFQGKGLFATLSAENHIALRAGVCLAAAQNGTFVQAAFRADLRPRFALVSLFCFNVAAQTAQRDLKFRIVGVSGWLKLLLAARKNQRKRSENR
jgi:hypothetical protein